MSEEPKIKTVITVPLLIGKEESINKKLNELVREMKKVPQLDVEQLNVSIEVNRSYRYVD